MDHRSITTRRLVAKATQNIEVSYRHAAIKLSTKMLFQRFLADWPIGARRDHELANLLRQQGLDTTTPAGRALFQMMVRFC